MNETKRLQVWWRMFRSQVGVGAAVAFALCCLIGQDTSMARLSSGETAFLTFPVLIGLVAIMVIGIQPRLLDSMFPVSDRELAWIPMASWALITLAGLAGSFVGQVWAVTFARIYYLSDLVPYWGHALQVLPGTLLISLLLWRAARVFNSTAFAVMPFLLSFGNPRLVPSWLTAAGLHSWPLWIAGCLFLIWEATYQSASIRRLQYQQSGKGSFWMAMRVPMPLQPMRRSWPTMLVNGLSALIAFAAEVLIIAHIIRMPLKQMWASGAPLFVGLCVVLFVSAVVWGQWRVCRASYMRPLQAIGVILLELTIVGYIFRANLGVLHGEPERCPACKDWRMPWQAGCPHCNDGRTASSGIPATAETISPGRLDPGRVLYRRLVPLYFLFFFLITHWDRWFK